jgi:hypothetical protein
MPLRRPGQAMVFTVNSKMKPLFAIIAGRGFYLNFINKIHTFFLYFPSI